MPGDRPIGTTQLICPICRASNVRRSRRRSFPDYLLSFAGILPWRCQGCEARFRARPSRLRNIIYAQCRICGNFALQRISPEHVPGVASLFGRLFGVPALRCEPCRHKFYSIRPMRRGERGEAAAPSE